MAKRYSSVISLNVQEDVPMKYIYGGTFIGGMPAIYLKGLLSGYAWTEDEEIIGNVYENKELLEDKE